MNTKLISAEEWIERLYACDGFQRKNLLQQIQLNALEWAASECVEYAKLMRGAHVNTNTSSAEIRRIFLSQIAELKKGQK